MAHDFEGSGWTNATTFYDADEDRYEIHSVDSAARRGNPDAQKTMAEIEALRGIRWWHKPGPGGGTYLGDGAGNPVAVVNPDGTPNGLGRAIGLESPGPRINREPNALFDQMKQGMGNSGNPMIAPQQSPYMPAESVNQPQVEVVNVKPPMRLTSTQNPSAGVKQPAQPNAPMQTQSDFGGGDAQSGEPPVMPWDYHEDPIAWLNRRAAEMYRREEA